MYKVNVEQLRRWIERVFEGDGKNTSASIKTLEPKVLDVFGSYLRFVFIPRNLIATQAELDKRSAFMKQYFIESAQNFEIAFKNALAAYYSAAFSMLRNFLEAVIVGATCEYLAHAQYRNNHKCIDENLINKIESLSADEKNDIEDQSSKILPIVWKFLEDGKIRKFNIRDLIMALNNWGAVHPLNDIDKIYNLYGELSGFTHQLPSYLDTTQRIIDLDYNSNIPVYEVRPMKENLDIFCDLGCRVLDVAIIIELNIMREFITSTVMDSMVVADQLRIISDENLSLPLTKTLLSQFSKQTLSQK